MTLFLDCARKIEFSGVLKVVSILCIEPSQFIFFKRLLVATISKCLQYLRCRSNLTHLKIFAVQSRKKGCKQIHKIKQNRFFCGNFCSWFFTVFFTKKRQNLDFEWLAGYSNQIQTFQGLFWNFLILKFPDPKNQVLVKKVKPLHKYCPAAIRRAFSPEFVLDAKV